MCVSADRDAEGTGKTEISEFQYTLTIDQQVLGLKISVKYRAYEVIDSY